LSWRPRSISKFRERYENFSNCHEGSLPGRGKRLMRLTLMQRCYSIKL
jgi:hypothetical protein